MMSAIAEQKGTLGAQQVGDAAKHIAAMTMQAHAGNLMAQQAGTNALGSLCLHACEENIEQELHGDTKSQPKQLHLTETSASLQ
jgi:hypothetical protein